MGISIASDTRTDHKKVARDNTQIQEQMILQNKGYTGESGFDPVELWVMGPPCAFKAIGISIMSDASIDQ